MQHNRSSESRNQRPAGSPWIAGAWVAAAAWAAACTGPVPPPTDTDTGQGPLATWSEAWDTTEAGALSGVYGFGPADVWMVGGVPTAGEAYHFDGAAWTPVAVPGTAALLVWVYGFAPDDVWAVGEAGTVVRWDGAAWAQVDAGVTADLWGVWGASPTDLWIVGGDPAVGTPTILHWDGAAFAAVALDPAENDRAATALFKVWGIDGRTFAVGQRGLALEWDGAAWRQMGTGANEDFVSLWGRSATDIVAVGGRANAQIATFDGSEWTTTLPSGQVGLSGLSAVSVDADRVVVGGMGGFVGTFDPVTGDVVGEEPPGAVDVHALWNDGAGTFYGVSGHFTEPYYGAAIVRRESR